MHRLLVVPKTKFKFRTPDFWRTGQDFAGNPRWSVNIFLMANAAGLGSYDAAALQQAMQKALPGLLIQIMPNKQSMLRRITEFTAHVNLSKLFRKVQIADQDTRS